MTSLAMPRYDPRVMDETALEARGVSKRYGNRDAIREVDLVVECGTLHGLLGPNGAGKTTLLRILLGLVRRDCGSVRLLGRPVDTTSTSIPDGVAGFVDTPTFYPYLSGRRNLWLLARLDNPRRCGPDTVDMVLEQVGLAGQADAEVAGYSAGMRQRLGVAAALLRSPRLLILDEPTGSLDPAGARDIRTLARRLADEGVAVVLSSHDMAEVEQLCTTLTVLNHGRVIFAGTAAQLRQRARGETHVLSTSDDRTALRMAAGRTGLTVASANGAGLEVSSALDALDAYVVALGRAGIAVRSLHRHARSLESVFLDLTA